MSNHTTVVDGKQRLVKQYGELVEGDIALMGFKITNLAWGDELISFELWRDGLFAEVSGPIDAVLIME